MSQLSLEDTSDIEWYRRVRDNKLVAGIAVICKTCNKVIPDIKLVEAGEDISNNCLCTPPEDYTPVIEAHGLGLVSSIFNYVGNIDDEAFKDMREHA